MGRGDSFSCFVSEQLRDVLNCVSFHQSSSFWLLVRAVKDFTLNEGNGEYVNTVVIYSFLLNACYVHNYALLSHWQKWIPATLTDAFLPHDKYIFAVYSVSGKLPLRGSIPDMTSDSERYIQLQNVYKQQAEQHVAAVTNYVHDHLHRMGKVPVTAFFFFSCWLCVQLK